jgi:hypothetical protein
MQPSPIQPSPTQPSSLTTMMLCLGQCNDVPEEVCNAVFESLQRIPGRNGEDRDARAADLAPRMAVEGWRFCPCFFMGRTEQHDVIFSLVHTNLANRLAHRAAQTRAA